LEEEYCIKRGTCLDRVFWHLLLEHMVRHDTNEGIEIWVALLMGLCPQPNAHKMLAKDERE
jgi:hypothetical protein